MFSHYLKLSIPLICLQFLSACSLTQAISSTDTSSNIEQLKKIEANIIKQCSTNYKKLASSVNQNTKANKSLEKSTNKLIKQLSAEEQQPECKATNENQFELQGKIILGELEWVYLPLVKEHFKARIDSGATTSSISAKNIVNFERNGKSWVRFTLEHKDTKIKPKQIEAAVVRVARIRQASATGIEHRPVIKLNLHLGQSLVQSAEFTLTNRSEMDFPVLLGREFLQDISLIEVGRTFTHSKYSVK